MEPSESPAFRAVGMFGDCHDDDGDDDDLLFCDCRYCYHSYTIMSCIFRGKVWGLRFWRVGTESKP